MIPEIALQHLETAEVTIMSFMQRMGSLPEDTPDEDVPDAMPMLVAVLRSVSRAAGILEAMKEDQ